MLPTLPVGCITLLRMSFDETYRAAYGFDAPSIDIGHVLRDGKLAGELPIRVPLRMMNRHGMIAGSTGTGKRARCSFSPRDCRAPACRCFWLM